MSTTADSFTQALEVLDQRGWTKAPAGEMGEICLGVALMRAESSAQAWKLVSEILAERYPDRCYFPYDLDPQDPSVALFNDHPDTTEEDVRLVLKLASERVIESPAEQSAASKGDRKLGRAYDSH